MFLPCFSSSASAVSAKSSRHCRVCSGVGWVVCHGRVPPGPLHWCPPVSPLTFWALSCKSGCTWSCRESPEPSPAFLGGGGREVSPPSKLPPPPRKWGQLCGGQVGLGSPQYLRRRRVTSPARTPTLPRGFFRAFCSPRSCTPKVWGAEKGGKPREGGQGWGTDGHPQMWGQSRMGILSPPMLPPTLPPGPQLPGLSPTQRSPVAPPGSH